MKNRLKALLPSPQSIKDNRWLRWMGPTLHHPRLWHFSRKGISMGLALGIFFGLLIPVAQIPLAAGAAIVLRANLPMAVASTLVTNPVTFGPVYFGAYHLGKWVLGQPSVGDDKAGVHIEKVLKAPPEHAGWLERIQRSVRYLTTVGKPLVVGLAILAVACGLLVYFLFSAAWTLRVRWTRSRRLRDRIQRPGAP
ncbi:MAG: DUF2062 domain-containing protein [Hydrogenophaga sp.]